MGILSLQMDFVGQQGVFPRRGKMVTTDNLGTVTAAGYLNNQTLQGNVMYPTDIIDAVIDYNVNTNSGVDDTFVLTISNGIISLAQQPFPGTVTLPVVDGDFANFDGTSGTIQDLGFVPSNPAKTVVVMLDAAPTINHVAKFTNANGTIGDGGVLGTAAAKAASNNAFANVASTTGVFTIGHVVSAADTAGSIQDSGIVASALQLSANIKAARTANIGGGGAGPISVAVAGLTAASIVTGSIQASSNPSTIEKMTATSTGFDVLFSADPGATCTVNYVAFVAAQ